jgi:uncharacterized protein (DUF1778 family)
MPSQLQKGWPLDDTSPQVVRFQYVHDSEQPAMPRVVIEDNKRMNLRIQPEQKALLARAAALAQTDLTSFVTQAALREAQSTIERAERMRLSARDSRLVLDLLENPPPLNRKLKDAVAALPKRK